MQLTLSECIMSKATHLRMSQLALNSLHQECLPIKTPPPNASCMQRTQLFNASTFKEAEAGTHNLTAYPLSTPRTRLRTKNEPRMIRLTKYIHGHSNPTESLTWKMEKVHYGFYATQDGKVPQPATLFLGN